jgi:hypothetical protein
MWSIYCTYNNEVNDLMDITIIKKKELEKEVTKYHTQKRSCNGKEKVYNANFCS